MAKRVCDPRNRRRLAVERLERRDAPSVSPAGVEFRANSTTAGAQDIAAVALDADGDFVAAWVGSDGSSDGIFAQRFGAAGQALGAEVRVNTHTTNQQTAPSVAANAAGDFVVVWGSNVQDGDGFGIYGQRYSAGGVRVGPEFHVSQTTAGQQLVPAVACDAAGNFSVVWQSLDGDNLGIFARRYAADGTARGGEFRVNTVTANAQQLASIGMDADGDFVVAWQSQGQDGSGFGIFARQFTADGVGPSIEFRVNSFTPGDQTVPSVAVDPLGNFTVAWQALNQGSATSGADVLAQRYTAAGAAVGANTVVAGQLFSEAGPVAARDGKGDTVITWTANTGEVQYRVLTAAGGLSAAAFVNTYTTGTQSAPAVSCDAAGDFVVVWSGEGTGDAAGVFGQRYDESTDVVAPRVTGLFQDVSPGPVAANERVLHPPAQLRVAFAEEMSVAGGAAGANSVVNPANWTLTRGGVAVALATIPLVYDASARRYQAILNLATPPLLTGGYRLTASDNLRDVAGNALDGDGDGVPGGAFVREFNVGVPAAAGPETVVNQTLDDFQQLARVGSDAAGNTVVVWESRDQFITGTNFNVYARRYNAAGAALGGEFRVNSYFTGKQDRAAVAVDADGDFVVVWESEGQDGSGKSIHAQRYNRAGVFQGQELRVNQTTAGDQTEPRVATDAAGNFVVAWTSDGQDGFGRGVYARRFDASGVALGDEFPVNVVTNGGQEKPDVAADADGDFVVVWQSELQDGSLNGIYLRRFDAGGTARGGEVPVNVTTLDVQSAPSVAMDATGDILVAWESRNQDGSEGGIFARRFQASGSAQTNEIAVNLTTANAQANPCVAMDADGDAVIVWQSDQQDGDGNGIVARRFHAGGAAVSGEFVVNAITTGAQVFPAVAANADGNFVVAYHTLRSAFDADVAFQRYAAPAAPRVAAVTANPGEAQRSRVLSIAVTFDTVVTIAGPLADAIGLSRIGGGAVGGFTAVAAVVDGRTVVTLSGFTGAETQFGSLADGRYQVTVRADRVSANAFLLDGDGNGIGGDDFALSGSRPNGLFRLFGDTNGDAVVNAADFAVLRNAFGSSVGQAAYRDFLDFDASGVVNAFDFAQFRTRFGANVP